MDIYQLMQTKATIRHPSGSARQHRALCSPLFVALNAVQGELIFGSFKELGMYLFMEAYTTIVWIIVE